MLNVELQVYVPGVTPETTRELMEAAHAVCPYSHAVKGNIEVKLVARTEAAETPVTGG